MRPITVRAESFFLREHKVANRWLLRIAVFTLLNVFVVTPEPLQDFAAEQIVPMGIGGILLGIQTAYEQDHALIAVPIALVLLLAFLVTYCSSGPFRNFVHRATRCQIKLSPQAKAVTAEDDFDATSSAAGTPPRSLIPVLTLPPPPHLFNPQPTPTAGGGGVSGGPSSSPSSLAARVGRALRESPRAVAATVAPFFRTGGVGRSAGEAPAGPARDGTMTIVMGASFVVGSCCDHLQSSSLLRPDRVLGLVPGRRCEHPTVLSICCSLTLVVTCADGLELRGMSSKAREPAPVISTAEVSLDDMGGAADEVPFEEKMALDEGAARVRAREPVRGGAETEGSRALAGATDGGGTLI
jgi:hypothetical protein